MKEWLYVLNFDTPGIYKIPMSQDDDVLDVLDAHGFKESECCWISTEQELELESEPYIKLK